jgi:hypothetical protein
MTTQNITIWTCNRCFVKQEESYLGPNPKNWVWSKEGTEGKIQHFCEDCVPQIRTLHPGIRLVQLGKL